MVAAGRISITITKLSPGYAPERGAYVLRLACSDDGAGGVSIAPKTLTWTLLDRSGYVINNRENVAILNPTASEIVTLYGADLALVNGETSTLVHRFFFVEGTYDSNLIGGGELPLKGLLAFDIINYDVGIIGSAILSLPGIDADDIAFTPCGDLLSINVGAALRELEAKKAKAWGIPTEITIVSGAVTLSGAGYYEIDTEGDADSDALTQLFGLAEGNEVILKPANDARTVVVTNGAYLKLNRGYNFTMDSIYDRIRLQCIGFDICVECGGRSSGGD